MAGYKEKGGKYKDQKNSQFEENLGKFDELMDSLGLLDAPQLTYFRKKYESGGAPEIRIGGDEGRANIRLLHADALIDPATQDTTFQWRDNETFMNVYGDMDTEEGRAQIFEHTVAELGHTDLVEELGPRAMYYHQEAIRNEKEEYGDAGVNPDTEEYELGTYGIKHSKYSYPGDETKSSVEYDAHTNPDMGEKKISSTLDRIEGVSAGIEALKNIGNDTERGLVLGMILDEMSRNNQITDNDVMNIFYNELEKEFPDATWIPNRTLKKEELPAEIVNSQVDESIKSFTSIDETMIRDQESLALLQNEQAQLMQDYKAFEAHHANKLNDYNNAKKMLTELTGVNPDEVSNWSIDQEFASGSMKSHSDGTFYKTDQNTFFGGYPDTKENPSTGKYAFGRIDNIQDLESNFKFSGMNAPTIIGYDMDNTGQRIPIYSKERYIGFELNLDKPFEQNIAFRQDVGAKPGSMVMTMEQRKIESQGKYVQTNKTLDAYKMADSEWLNQKNKIDSLYNKAAESGTFNNQTFAEINVLQEQLMAYEKDVVLPGFFKLVEDYQTGWDLYSDHNAKRSISSYELVHGKAGELDNLPPEDRGQEYYNKEFARLDADIQKIK
jgi:hypothetical protein